ncbi:MAG: pilus assembly protein [Sinomonas sp.]|nr:pilus assembly protein [Sinomonas sp.]
MLRAAGFSQHPPPQHERGSAPAEFVLVGCLLTALAVAIVQLTLVLHVRNTLVDAAASAARYGVLADRSAEDAQLRATDLITASLGAAYASDVSVEESRIGEIDVVEVRVRAPLPVVGLLGPGGILEVSGHAPLQ